MKRPGCGTTGVTVYHTGFYKLKSENQRHGEPALGFGLKKCLLVADTIEKTKEEEIEIEKRRLENAEK